MEPTKAKPKEQPKHESKEVEEALLVTAAKQVADAIEAALPEGVGFGLFVFAPGSSGFMSWISKNVDHDETIRAIETWLALEKRVEQERKE